MMLRRNAVMANEKFMEARINELNTTNHTNQ